MQTNCENEIFVLVLMLKREYRWSVLSPGLCQSTAAAHESDLITERCHLPSEQCIEATVPIGRRPSAHLQCITIIYAIDASRIMDNAIPLQSRTNAISPSRTINAGTQCLHFLV